MKKYNSIDSEPGQYHETLEAIANELAEANRLRRIELMKNLGVLRRDVTTEELEDKA